MGFVNWNKPRCVASVIRRQQRECRVYSRCSSGSTILLTVQYICNHVAMSYQDAFSLGFFSFFFPESPERPKHTCTHTQIQHTHTSLVMLPLQICTWHQGTLGNARLLGLSSLLEKRVSKWAKTKTRSRKSEEVLLSEGPSVQGRLFLYVTLV